MKVSYIHYSTCFKRACNWSGHHKWLVRRSSGHLNYSYHILSPGHPIGPLTRYAKLRVAHAPGMSITFSPPPRVSDPDMHHGTCVTHVPWCMQGSLTSGFLWSRCWRNVPGIPGACAAHNFAYLVRGPCIRTGNYGPFQVQYRYCNVQRRGLQHAFWISFVSIWYQYHFLICGLLYHTITHQDLLKAISYNRTAHQTACFRLNVLWVPMCLINA